MSFKAILKVWENTQTPPATRGRQDEKTLYTNAQLLDVEFSAETMPELLYKIEGHAKLMQKPEDR